MSGLALSRVNPLLQRPVSNPRCVSTAVVGAGLPANTVVVATVNGGWRLASRAGPFAGEPAPTTACVQPPTCVRHRSGVGAGLPANTVVVATVSGRWRLASSPGPFAGEPAPTTACVQPPTCVRHRSGVGAGLPANTVTAATLNGWGYWPAGPALSRVNPLLRRPVSSPRPVSATDPV